MRELLNRLARHPWLTLELGAASFFVNILAFADTIFVMIVLRRYITYGFDGTLVLLTLGTIAAILMQLGLRLARTRLAHGVSRIQDRELSERFFDTLVRARAANLPDMEGGKDYQQALLDMRQAYDAPKVIAFLDAPFSLIFVAATWMLSYQLAAVVLAGMLISLVLGLITVRRNYEIARSVNTLGVGVRVLLSAAWAGADAVRAFGGRELYRKMWKKRMAAFESKGVSAGSDREFGQGLTGAASVLVRVGVYAVGAKLVVEGRLTVAGLIGASILGSYAIQKISVFVQTWPSLSQAVEAMARLEEFFALPLERKGGKVLEDYSGGLEFQDVAHTFEGGKAPLFSGLTFKLDPGGVMAVKGYNGSGKTTLMRLMAGLLEPSEGRILADGVPLAELDSQMWRGCLVYMPQEPEFVSATVRDNILSNRPDLDAESLNKAVRDSGLREFIDSSPKGLETMLTGAGANLPLGTRKRLALARALATDGRLVLMDEPSDGLDLEGRKAVYQVMNQLANQGRSIVVVTHDPSILKGARLTLDLSVKPVPELTRSTPEIGTPVPEEGEQ